MWGGLLEEDHGDLDDRGSRYLVGDGRNGETSVPGVDKSINVARGCRRLIRMSPRDASEGVRNLSPVR